VYQSLLLTEFHFRRQVVGCFCGFLTLFLGYWNFIVFLSFWDLMLQD